MKKKLFIFLSFLAYGTVHAQPDTIHWGETPWLPPQVFMREYPRDTVQFGDPRFLFDAPYDLTGDLPWGSYAMIPYIVVKQFVAPESTLFGIAMAGYFYTNDMDIFRVAFCAYKKEHGDMRLLDTVDFSNYYTVNAFEHIETNPNTGERNIMYPYLYEYYFDHAHKLQAGDTIYVGVYNYKLDYSLQIHNPIRMLYGYTPTPRVWLKNIQGSGWSRYEYLSPRWGGIIPIVQPDLLHCRVPRRFAVDSEQSLTSATFSWASKPCDCDTLELRLHSFDSLGRPADSLLHTVHGDTACTLGGLDTGIYYSATLRARCHHRCPSHDTLLHSPWTAPLRFYLGDREPTLVDTTPAAFQPPTSDFLPTIHPNPTTGILNVEFGNLNFEGTGATLQLLDLEGRLLQEFQIPNSKFQIDLSSYPAGTYLLRAAGTTRRVVKR